MNDAFRAQFGRSAEVVASAPGRVNLIGEHTDYNGGFVLPSALPHETRAAVAPRTDLRVTAITDDSHLEPSSAFEVGSEVRRHSWIDYVQGLTWALRERGAAIRGFDLMLSSTVPTGKGLSSSAALEISVLRALNTANQLGLDDLEIAVIAHHAETGFVGAPVGIMDQMVCSLGDRTTALFIDTASRTFEKIPIPADVELGVIDSGIAHSHASGEYRTRRRECEQAAALLGVNSLRDVTVSDLSRIEQLPDPLDRRARHVVTENHRVLAAVDALRCDQPTQLGQLFGESHTSLRDDFAVSLPDIDWLVEIASRHPHSYGARLTGGGFGGAVVVLCQQGRARGVMRDTAEQYRAVTHHIGTVLLPTDPPAA